GNETAPDERFDQFIDLWNDGSYEQMYEMISSDAKDMFPIEEATERQEHIYNDLNVSNLKVTAEDVSDETINESQESGEIAIPFSVSMDTLAGNISFDYEAKLIRE